MQHKISAGLLRKFEPKREWLKHPSYYHGVGHLTRVFILQELICNLLDQKGVSVDRSAVRYAAMAHDLGRVNDFEDPSHGMNSAKWMKDNLTNVLAPETLDTATYIVHWHSLPDGEAPVMTTELKVLKDADGLDRARLGDMDESYLRLDVSKSLIGTAQKLFEASKQGDSSEVETFEDVIKACRELDLIR